MKELTPRPTNDCLRPDNPLAARQFFTRLGFNVIPLLPNSKKTTCKKWPHKSPEELWDDAPRGANVGIRCGSQSHLAILDCDEKNGPGVFQNAVAWLDGLGIERGNYPVVQSASGCGRHIYLRVNTSLNGCSKNLRSEFGAGELRYGRGAYVVAAGSIVDGSLYVWMEGDFHQLPVVCKKDLATIIDLTALDEKELNQPPTDISRRTWYLLKQVGLCGYSSRSEKEQAIMVGLVNAGRNFQQVENLFKKFPGVEKYHELEADNPQRAREYLLLSFENATRWAKNHENPVRAEVAQIMAWAHSACWPGKSGPYDKDMFIAHLQIAYAACKTTYAASLRELAQLAATSSPSASNATDRLINDRNLLKRVQQGRGTLSSIYQLTSNCKSLALPHRGWVGECKGYASHDAFRFSGLGKFAWEVWTSLADGPMMVSELEQVTGRTARTVQKHLDHMSQIICPDTGEILAMVYPEGDKWARGPVDLDLVAAFLQTSGKGEAEFEKHARERYCHRKVLKSKQNSAFDAGGAGEEV